MARGTDVTDFKRVYRTAVADEFPDQLNIGLLRQSSLRYGENPNQPAAMYSFAGTDLSELTNVRLAKGGKGGVSATNSMDVTRGMHLVGFFPDPAVAVMKHALPSGFARQHAGNTLDDIYVKARDADSRSAFGSIVV